jgi:hypothetical protein
VHIPGCPRGFLNFDPAQDIDVQADACCVRRSGREHRMLDVIMLAIGLGFFALSVGYAMACDQL